jgi:hypothetical protein
VIPVAELRSLFRHLDEKTHEVATKLVDHAPALSREHCRVPVGVFFRSVIRFKELGLGDIEIIQPHHRYVTAWPSIHPKTGQQYRWISPDGTLLPEGRATVRRVPQPDFPTPRRAAARNRGAEQPKESKHHND